MARAGQRRPSIGQDGSARRRCRPRPDGDSLPLATARGAAAAAGCAQRARKRLRSGGLRSISHWSSGRPGPRCPAPARGAWPPSPERKCGMRAQTAINQCNVRKARAASRDLRWPMRAPSNMKMTGRAPRGSSRARTGDTRLDTGARQRAPAPAPAATGGLARASCARSRRARGRPARPPILPRAPAIPRTGDAAAAAAARPPARPP